MITKAMYDYLTGTTPITGMSSADFRAAQVVGDLQVTNREDARRYLRDRIGKEIYSARRPRGGSQHTAITLRPIAAGRVEEVTGGTTLVDTIVQSDIWTKGAGAALRCSIVAGLLRLCCEGFGNAPWGAVYVADCVVVRDAMLLESPDDGDEWQYRCSMDFDIFHTQPSPVV